MWLFGRHSVALGAQAPCAHASAPRGGPTRELGLLRIARWACCTVQVVDVGLMAEAMEFCATQDSCRNQAFNLSNGDTFRWSQVCVCCWVFVDVVFSLWVPGGSRSCAPAEGPRPPEKGDTGRVSSLLGALGVAAQLLCSAVHAVATPHSIGWLHPSGPCAPPLAASSCSPPGLPDTYHLSAYDSAPRRSGPRWRPSLDWSRASAQCRWRWGKSCPPMRGCGGMW